MKPSIEMQILTFEIKQQLFGLDILRVREITEYMPLTPVPLVPDFILGVINLRGNVVPVIDLSKRFSWDKTTPTKESCIIITELEYEEQILEIGILVDSVKEVLRCSTDDLRPPPNFGMKVRIDFIESVFKSDEKFILLLNLNKVLSIEELSELRSITQENDPNATPT